VSADPLAVAEHLFAAIEAGDVDAVRELYTPDTVVWHNSDGVEQSAEQNVKVLRWVIRNVRNLRYDEVRRERTERGFVQQHVLRGTAANGAEVAIPACIVGVVKDGRIVRLDEYLDSAHVRPLLGAS